MEGIIDIHSHILPGIDDGASTLEASLHLLGEAYRQGIREVVATPHYSRRFPNNCPDRIRQQCRKLQVLARERQINIRIHPGQEILYTEDVPEKIARGELLTLADSHYVLIEFYPGASSMEILRAVQMLVREGFSPVLAHVERYRALMREEKLEELTDQGAFLQMNFDSLCGSWLDEKVRRCRRLLKEHYIHFMGTDMHNMSSRRPETREAVSWMRRKLDAGYVRDLLGGNAEKLVNNEKNK